MKRLYYLAILVMVSGIATAQQTLMPACTKAAMQVIQKDLVKNRSLPSQKVIDFYPIYRFNGQYYIAVMGKVNSVFRKSSAIADGIDVGAMIGPVISMRIPLFMFRENFSYPGIEYLEMAEKLDPDLDGALIDTRANLVHQGVDLPQAYTGKGVLIGVVDWGFDYSHPTFYDTTLTHSRITAAWDQVKVIGTPPDGFSYGALYTGEDELRDIQHDTFSIISDYHGTHVAGIAGGSGGGTKYRGIGFESDLLFSQMRQDLSSSVDAFQWMFNISQETGKRLVINNSWGGYRSNPLDGTSLVSQAIDALSAQGVVFVNSGANNGGINFHLKKTFNQDSVRTRIMGFEYSQDDELWGQTVNMWGEAGHPFSVQFRVINSQNMLLAQSELIHTGTAAAFIDSFLLIGNDTVFYNFMTDAAHPLNGRPQMTLNVRNTNTSLRNIVYAQADSGTVHFWNTRLTVYGGGNWGKGFTAPAGGYSLGDRNYGIGHPAVTSSAITAAAHMTNSGITNFSSYGPRMDDFIKPDISAPGEAIISSLNSFAFENLTAEADVTFNGKTYEFGPLSGTSMSAPMVTGIVSLILEADPNLSAADVKGLLIDQAREDGQTGAIGPEGNVRWGFGKADAYNCIQALTSTDLEQPVSHAIPIFPNPASDIVRYDGVLDGSEIYQLFTQDGKKIQSGLFQGELNVGELPNAIYILQLKNKNEVRVYKITVVH